ncbi:polymer-forming cytoskeletal protein [Pseudoneobacillus sp. C159]
MNVNQQLGNLMINGLGSSNGGNFDSVTINGKGTINSDIQCNSFSCNGAGTVHGDVKGEHLKISGTTKITGKIQCSTISVDGKGSFKSDLYFNKMNVSGMSSIDGNVKGEDLKVQGRISVDGNCEVENFKSEGQFSIDGLLSAETIDIYTYGECKAREIGGQTIRVKEKTNFLLDLLKAVKSVKLSVDTIEGDDISLENTKAKVVRGNHVVIGENCEIELVEYKDDLKVVGNGRIHKSVQV